MKVLGVSVNLVLVNLIITVGIITFAITMAPERPERRYNCEPQTTVVPHFHWS